VAALVVAIAQKVQHNLLGLVDKATPAALVIQITVVMTILVVEVVPVQPELTWVQV
jgi:hypothetical protein